jgi:hypothetical protein
MPISGGTMMSDEPIAHDDLQPMSETQVAQLEAHIAKLERGHQSMWEIPEGTELTWDLVVSPELVIMYADGVEDYNPWYEAWPVGPGESPFGTAVAPPMLVPRMQHYFHREGQGRSEIGGVAVSWSTELIEPVLIGTTVRWHGKLTRRYIKRGRQYTEREFTIVDAETGKLLIRHTATALAQFARVEEPDTVPAEATE